jgi:hypothetical protein
MGFPFRRFLKIVRNGTFKKYTQNNREKQIEKG